MSPQDVTPDPASSIYDQNQKLTDFIRKKDAANVAKYYTKECMILPPNMDPFQSEIADLPLKFGPFIKLVNSSICSLLYFSLALWPYWVVKRPRGRVADIRGHYAASYDYTHFANALQAL